jgi:putative tryptophan/tyrosine transport system substrate-binding protein
MFPGTAAGQSSRTHMPVIGLLTWTSCDGPANASGLGEYGSLKHGLEEFGYRPGETVTIECRSAHRRYERFSSASSFVGYSIAAPEINFTGIVNFTIELTDKRLELLKEMVPTINKIGVLSNPTGLFRTYEAHTKRAADKLGLAVNLYRLSEPTNLENMFAQMKLDKVDAAFLLPDLTFASEAPLIGALAIKYRIPTMGWDAQLTEAGFLMAYSGNDAELERRLAFYVDRILDGAQPGRLLFEQPSEFLLSINLRTANALGIVVPPSLLLVVDEVIE